MNATLLDLPIERPETVVSCANCPAVERLERALEELRAEFPWQVGYSLPRESLACPLCGKPATRMSATEDSELLEIDVRVELAGRHSQRWLAADRADDAADPATASRWSKPTPGRISTLTG